MQLALRRMSLEGIYSSYDLGVSLSTMYALYHRGLVKYNSGLGSIWSPRTSIDWYITEAGVEKRIENE